MGFAQFFILAVISVSNYIALHVPVPAQMSGIYLTASSIGSSRGDELVDQLVKVGGNTVVIDVQAGGKFAYPSKVTASVALGSGGNVIPDLRAAVAKLHKKDIYVIGRFILFKNEFLTGAKKEWALKDKNTGKTFNNRDGAIWLDPGHPELLSYYADICRELADAGFDEIQFDYVRFPEAGKNYYIGYNYTGHETITREQTITNAVKYLGEVLHKKGVAVGIDVFGIIVWDKISGPIIGQDIAALAPYVDAIYPMSYPSHFGPGWGGHENPADEPYFFNYETTKKFIEQTAGSGAEIRPWLQGFVYRVTNFDSTYVSEEIKALKDLGITQYIVWNAANNYPYTFKAFAREK
ncbi:hypothetical protein KBD59_00390 [Candidatus Gracilibacteria bacterium]|nr:hypothetical protein [Candidatus Gracilibacteria bacterium]